MDWVSVILFVWAGTATFVAAAMVFGIRLVCAEVSRLQKNLSYSDNVIEQKCAKNIRLDQMLAAAHKREQEVETKLADAEARLLDSLKQADDAIAERDEAAAALEDYRLRYAKLEAAYDEDRGQLRKFSIRLGVFESIVERIKILCMGDKSVEGIECELARNGDMENGKASEEGGGASEWEKVVGWFKDPANWTTEGPLCAGTAGEGQGGGAFVGPMPEDDAQPGLDRLAGQHLIVKS